MWVCCGKSKAHTGDAGTVKALSRLTGRAGLSGEGRESLLGLLCGEGAGRLRYGEEDVYTTRGSGLNIMEFGMCMTRIL